VVSFLAHVFNFVEFKSRHKWTIQSYNTGPTKSRDYPLSVTIMLRNTHFVELTKWRNL